MPLRNWRSLNPFGKSVIVDLQEDEEAEKLDESPNMWRRMDGYFAGIAGIWTDVPTDDNIWVNTEDEPSIHGEDPMEGDVNLGIYTKYYSKRIS